MMNDATMTSGLVSKLNNEHGIVGKELASGSIKFADCSKSAIRKHVKSIFPDMAGKDLDKQVKIEQKRLIKQFNAGFDVAFGASSNELSKKDFTVKYDESGNLVDARFHLRSETLSPLSINSGDKSAIDALVSVGVTDIETLSAHIAKRREDSASRFVKSIEKYIG